MIIFLIAGIVGIAIGIIGILLRNRIAQNANGQIDGLLRSARGPRYSPWIIVLAGGGMIAIGLYFVVASVIGITRS